jgi:hypothetical protein
MEETRHGELARRQDGRRIEYELESLATAPGCLVVCSVGPAELFALEAVRLEPATFELVDLRIDNWSELHRLARGQVLGICHHEIRVHAANRGTAEGPVKVILRGHLVERAWAF